MAISLLTLAVVLGVWLIVPGGMQLGLAFRALSVRHRARPTRAMSAYVRRQCHAGDGLH